MAGIPEPVDPRNLRFDSLPQFIRQFFRVLKNGCRSPAANIEGLTYRTIVMSNEPISLHDILHMHIIALQQSIFKNDRRLPIHQAKRKDAGDSRVLVEQRLPWPLSDRVPQGYTGNI